jgi:hypothetical protein
MLEVPNSLMRPNQVVVSNGTQCYSDSARLMVNEITAVIPNATNVSQCYSSYTYTVSTHILLMLFRINGKSIQRLVLECCK